jgi:hypothetical protein
MSKFAAGIPVDRTSWAEIAQLAARHDCPLPDPIA